MKHIEIEEIALLQNNMFITFTVDAIPDFKVSPCPMAASETYLLSLAKKLLKEIEMENACLV